ncbi:AAA family ATPase [Lapillicoccus sp.]|uniref:AAA family ATPase n=1 Tax=Lapillicoccus sp. TaxID=1909287 RepID=UPI0039834ADB
MPQLEQALDALAEVARRLGLDAHEARREGVVLSATVAEPASPTYRAAQDWARATGMADADDIAAANDAFISSASSGRKWRASPSALVTHLRATGTEAKEYADALVTVVEAASTLGTTNARVTANIIRAAEAQRSGATGSPAPGTRFDPALAPFQDPRILESLRLLHGPGAQAPALPAPSSGGPDADPTARHTGESADGTAASGQDVAVTEATTDAAADPEPERSVEELLGDLDAMIGLERVKREVHQQVAMLKVEARRDAAGLRNPDVTRHLVFVGNPGTGKTTVARMVSGIYRALGLLSKGHLVEVDRSELVAGYLGQTAIKTAEVCTRAAGGVLFIDEAYSLGGDQYGTEAIGTLVKEMEDRRDELVVIVAGYPDPMVVFIAQNPGLASRFKTTIDFADYTDDEVVDILGKLADGADYDVSPDAQEAFRAILAGTARNQSFGNGRFARNLLEEAIGRHAWRLQDIEEPTTEQLRLLLTEDFRPPETTDVDPSPAEVSAASGTSAAGATDLPDDTRLRGGPG